MNEMIERVGAVIEKMLDEMSSGDYTLNYVIDGHLASSVVARAAIEAMRTPTAEMIEASNREWDGRMSYRSSGAWQAMIDAALKNDTPPKP